MKSVQAAEAIKSVLRVGLVPLLLGKPGLGKSDLVRSIVKEKELELIDLRIAQLDTTDFNGLPSFKGDKATYSPFDVFPLENDPLPKGKNGWILFLDEITNAPKSIQAAA